MEDYFKPYEKWAQKKGFQFGCSASQEVLFPTYGSDPVLNHKFFYLQHQDLLFWASDSYAVKFGMNSTYSGLYCRKKLPVPDFHCRISRRFFLDFLVGGKRDKLGIPEIDKRVKLHTNHRGYARRMITTSLVSNYLQLPKALSPVDVIMNADYIPRFAGHEHEQLSGLETNRWYTVEELDLYWDRLEKFIRQIIS